MIREYNAGAHRLFRWAVTPLYIDSLKEVDHAGGDEIPVLD